MQLANVADHGKQPIPHCTPLASGFLIAKPADHAVVFLTVLLLALVLTAVIRCACRWKTQLK